MRCPWWPVGLRVSRCLARAVLGHERLRHPRRARPRSPSSPGDSGGRRPQRRVGRPPASHCGSSSMLSGCSIVCASPARRGPRALRRSTRSRCGSPRRCLSPDLQDSWPVCPAFLGAADDPTALPRPRCRVLGPVPRHPATSSPTMAARAQWTRSPRGLPPARPAALWPDATPPCPPVLPVGIWAPIIRLPQIERPNGVGLRRRPARLWSESQRVTLPHPWMAPGTPRIVAGIGRRAAEVRGRAFTTSTHTDFSMLDERQPVGEVVAAAVADASPRSCSPTTGMYWSSSSTRRAGRRHHPLSGPRAYMRGNRHSAPGAGGWSTTRRDADGREALLPPILLATSNQATPPDGSPARRT